MYHSPFVIVSAAGLATLLLGQVIVPTVNAQPKASTDYCVRIDAMQTKRTAGGLEITGRIINTGRQALTYTSVVPIFVDNQGKEVGRGSGYLTSGPVEPGQSAEFRASEPTLPKFAHVQMTLRERGMPVLLECPPALSPH